MIHRFGSIQLCFGNSCWKLPLLEIELQVFRSAAAAAAVEQIGRVAHGEVCCAPMLVDIVQYLTAAILCTA